MRKSINIVLIGVLALAGIILALPFTPLRSSFSNVTTKYTAQVFSSMGIDLNGKVNKARKIAGNHQYEVTSFELSVLNNVNKSVKGGAGSSMNELESGTYSASLQNLEKITGNSGFSSNNLSFNGYKRSGSSGNVNNGIASNFSKSTSKNSSGGGTVKQSSNGDSNGTGGGTHPGVDPIGNLPVGDGITFLFILAVGYLGLKKCLI